jgi:hypothetical protein
VAIVVVAVAQKSYSFLRKCISKREKGYVGHGNYPRNERGYLTSAAFMDFLINSTSALGLDKKSWEIMVGVVRSSLL